MVVAETILTPKRPRCLAGGKCLDGFTRETTDRGQATAITRVRGIQLHSTSQACICFLV
jgi:hypothetical protein